MKNPTSIQFAIYSRKSRFTGKGESIGNQVEMCRDYIRLRYSPEDAEHARIYEDEGFSGGNLNRPGFQQMMTDAKEKKFEAVVIYRLDRISRSIGDFSNLILALSELDVEFICIKEQFDTSSPMGRAMMYISSVFSQLERETIAERIRDNMQELAKTGRWLGGVTPTGYTSESVTSVTIDGKQRKACKLKIIPEEADLVRRIYDIYRETDSLTGTEAELLRLGITTKRGNSFTRFSIKNILQNPVYVMADETIYQYFIRHNGGICSPEDSFDGIHGIMAYNRTNQSQGSTSAIQPIHQWTVCVGDHPGLVSAKCWLSVQRSLERNKSKSYRKPRSNTALLTSLLYCTCGSRMYAKLTDRTTEDGQPLYVYMCKEKERSKRTHCGVRNPTGNFLDEAILAQLKLLTEDHAEFRRQLDASRKLFVDRQNTDFLAELKKKRSELGLQIDSLVDTLTTLGDSTAKIPITSRIETLAAEQQSLSLRIDALSELYKHSDMGDDQFAIYVDLLSIFSNTCQDMGLEQKRAAVRTLVRQVVWDGETAHVLLFGCENEALKSLWGEDSK